MGQWPETCEWVACRAPATEGVSAYKVPHGYGRWGHLSMHLCADHLVEAQRLYEVARVEKLIPINHRHLLKVMTMLPADYDPWGSVVRWSDPEQSYPDCSCGCRWYAELAGQRGMDWGVCTNTDSHRCGLLTFEHQGCLHFDPDDRGEDE